MTKLKGKAKARARKKKVLQSKKSAAAYKEKMLSKILKYDNEILMQECGPVSQGNPHVLETISTMKKVLGCTENGVGLAASQIGILERVIILKPDARKYKTIAMINPEIISYSENKKYGIEGCLSYPATFSPVERYVSIKVKYFDEDWKKCVKEYKESEIEGIIVQHEIEHLSEGYCQIHDWWKDPEGKQVELRERFEKDVEPEEVVGQTGGYDIVESEDFKKEREELAEEICEDVEVLAEAIESGEDLKVKTVKVK